MEFGLESICVSAFTVLCVGIAFIYRHICKKYTYFDKLELTGPVPSFLLGTWKEAREKFLGDFDVENAKLYGKVYGTFDALTPNLMVIEPDIIKQVLLTHANKFYDRRPAFFVGRSVLYTIHAPEQNRQLLDNNREQPNPNKHISTTGVPLLLVENCKHPILKKCLATLYGEEDRKVHALTNTLLPDSKIQKLIPTFESSSNILVQNILKRKEEGVGFNFISIVNDYIHSLIALMVFGIDLNSDVIFRDEFVGYCDQIFNGKNPNSMLALIMELHDQLQGDNWIIPQKALDYFVNLIKAGINDTPKDPVLIEGKVSNLIEILVEAAEEEKKLVKGEKEDETDLILTEEFIIVKCLSTILALVNTAQSVVLLAIQCLGNQLEIQDELSREVEKNKAEKLSIVNLQNLKILDMVIAEVLRLHPSEFRVEKVCRESVTIDRFNFVNGNRVSVPLFALHRQEDLYPEHEKFDPKRFSQEAVENRNPFTYLPFGQAGINSHSISIKLALLASKISIFKLVEKLKFKAPDSSKRIIFKKGITGVPKLAALNITTEVRI